MEKTVRVQLIGNYLEPLKKILPEKKLIVENIIAGCSPLAMCGLPQSEYTEFYDKVTHTPTILTLKKNLANMLSHDEEKFQSNIVYQPLGTDVRYTNKSDWVIISNNLIGYTLFEKNDCFYSDSWPSNDFINFVKNPQNGFNKLSMPFPDNFNWKYYYDKFIDTILSEYPRDHIILIKTNSAQWYFNDESNQIMLFDNKSIKYRNFVEKVDDYFIQNTNCKYIDNAYSFISPTSHICAFTYGQTPYEYYISLSKSIFDIIYGKTKKEKIIRNFNSAVKMLKQRLTNSCIQDNIEVLSAAEENWNSLDDIVNSICSKTGSNDFIYLKAFFTNDLPKLSEYIVENIDTINYEIIKSYVKYIKLDINDICALYHLYNTKNDTEKIAEIVSMVIQNESFSELISNQNLYENNRKFLSEYAYIKKEFLEYSSTTSNLLINSSWTLKIDSSSSEPFKLIKYRRTASVDDILSNGMFCSVYEIADLCMSWNFYIHRAQKGLTNTPVTILFNDICEFNDSLYFIDYDEIIKSERFVFALRNSELDKYPNYKGIVNLDFLFHDKVIIGHISLGLSDQMCYYTFEKYLAEKTDSELYFDDIFCKKSKVFNGLEIEKFSLENISDKLISNHISKQLLQNFAQEKQIADILYSNGVDDLVFTEISGLVSSNSSQKCPKLILQGLNLAPILNANFRILYFVSLVRPDSFFNNVDNYLKFPNLNDEVNKNLFQTMDSCDSVVFHVRRGDFISIGRDTDMDFYKESMEKLLSINDYPNKKYFIFSDDIPWCRDNLSELGFDLIENPDVTFVDNNRGEESYRDMQLMANAKIIIASNSGFARMAAMLSKTCEVFMCYNLYTVDGFKKIGKFTKYDVGPYKKQYRTDYSSTKPKK